MAAKLFNVHRSEVWRIWKRAKQCRDTGIPVDIYSRKPKNSGRKKVQVDLSQFPTIPLHSRSTIRSLAEALGANKSTLHKLFKQGLLRRHSNTIKPYLTEANKKEKLSWCISMLDPVHCKLNQSSMKWTTSSTWMRSGTMPQKRT
jgi:predicted transcriptional regulator